MKLAIFGDSFAEHISTYPGESWVSLFKKDSDFQQVDSYGLHSTNLYWSYLKFFEHYEKYDKAIFVVTSPFRFITTFKNLSSHGNINHILKTQAWSTERIKILKAIRDFSIHGLSDQLVSDQFVLFQSLMLEKIKNTNFKILFVPAFRYKNTEFDSETALMEITEMENKYWKVDKVYDKRQCHLSENNNKILYEILKSKIISLDAQSSSKLDINMFTKPDDYARYKQ